MPSNTAEENDSFTQKNTIKFSYYLKGTCAELWTHIDIKVEISYTSKGIAIESTTKIKQISKVLNSQINNLKPEYKRPTTYYFNERQLT